MSHFCCLLVVQDRETPLHIAVRTKNLEMANLLLDQGASPDSMDKVLSVVVIKSTFINYYQCSCQYLTIYISSCSYMSVKVIHSDNFMTGFQNKCTPLHIAAREGDEELVATLLEHKANVNLLSKVFIH